VVVRIGMRARPILASYISIRLGFVQFPVFDMRSRRLRVLSVPHRRRRRAERGFRPRACDWVNVDGHVCRCGRWRQRRLRLKFNVRFSCSYGCRASRGARTRHNQHNSMTVPIDLLGRRIAGSQAGQLCFKKLECQRAAGHFTTTFTRIQGWMQH
jgi:hypothetical protein